MNIIIRLLTIVLILILPAFFRTTKTDFIQYTDKAGTVVMVFPSTIPHLAGPASYC